MENKRLTPVKAIRAKCLDCCCGSSHEVKLCCIPDCSLFPYRLGKNPARKGTRLPKERSFLGNKASVETGFLEGSQDANV
jgi:hypothetical protein